MMMIVMDTFFVRNAGNGLPLFEDKGSKGSGGSGDGGSGSRRSGSRCSRGGGSPDSWTVRGKNGFSIIACLGNGAAVFLSRYW